MKQKLLYLLLVPSFFYGESLIELINYAHVNNNVIISKNLKEKSKKYEVESSQSLNKPTFDIGGFYQNLNKKSPSMPGDIYNGYAKISYDIYDGGKKSFDIKSKDNELKSTIYENIAYKKNLSLQIVQDFFNIKNIDASISALEEEKKSLEAQLQRVKKFYKAQLSTTDEIDKLQSAYDTNSFNIQSSKFQRLSIIQSLELKIGKKILKLNSGEFNKLADVRLKIDDNINSLVVQAKSLENKANSINSVYSPHIIISDTYNIYEYDRTDDFHPEGLDNQNKLMINVSMRIFDGGAISKKKQSIMINKQALKVQIDYKIQEQKMLYNLSISRINTNKLKIKSAKSALTSATSAYKTIEKKYKAGLVDNIVYLDALSIKTNATALYTKSLNDLEVAYAIYYYYAGQKIKEFIK